MVQLYRKYTVQIIGFAFLVLGVVMVFNRAFGSALILLLFLGAVTLFGFLRAGLKEKEIYILFLVTLFIYLFSAVFIHYTKFYPLGGGEGDELGYQRAAVVIAHDFQRGNFSLETIQYHLKNTQNATWYPIVIGVAYALTVSDMLVGQMLSVWFTGLSILLLYLLARELGAIKKWAFTVGFIGIFYPSLVYFGSLMIRESMVAVLFLLALLCIVKLIKRFSLSVFSIVYGILFVLISLRFYVGLAALFAFALVLPLLGVVGWRKKLSLCIGIVLLLGFLPQLLGYGYYATTEIKTLTQQRQITAFRKFVAGSSSPEPPLAPIDQNSLENPLQSSGISQQQVLEEIPAQVQQQQIELGSTVFVSPGFGNPFTFIRNSGIAFSYVLLGPFPWHIRYMRQLYAFLEIVPWWVIFFFIVKGLFRARKHYRLFLPIVFASFILIGAISLLINNYGTYMRIRIPAFLALLSLLPLAFQKHEKDKLIP